MDGWKLGYHANCWGPLGGDAVGVTSVKNLLYRTFGDMARAAHEIGAAGYTGIELFDGNLADMVQDQRRWQGVLGDAGLTLVAAYSGGNFIFPEILGEELWRIERAAANAALFGAEHLVVGGGAQRADGIRADDYARLGEALEQVVAIAARHGLEAHYHPHLSTIAETPGQVAQAFAHTSIKFCPDTAHLAAAGGDPATMIREHAERITYVHLKGFQRDPFAFTPLDVGDLDMTAVVAALVDIDFKGWVLTELDAWQDPAVGAAQSFRFLQRATARTA